MDELESTEIEQSASEEFRPDPGDLVIAEIQALSEQGEPLIDFNGNPAGRPVVASSTVAITRAHIGRQVALMFIERRADRPLIIGLIRNPLLDMFDNFEIAEAPLVEGAADAEPSADPRPINATIDGEQVVLEGREKVVLRCGEASITLTRAGKILIRGRYLSNRSTGVNRILGGSVQVN